MTKWTMILSVALLLAAASSASAQRRPGRYYPPYGPTISPYLQYYNRPVGVFGNYYTFVRPEVQLRSVLRAQEQQITTLDTQLRQVESEASRVREQSVAPTGTGSVYMNYSHYYSQGPR